MLPLGSWASFAHRRSSPGSGRSEAQEPCGRVHGLEDAYFNRTYWWLVSRLYHRNDVLLIILAWTAQLSGDVRLLAFELGPT